MHVLFSLAAGNDFSTLYAPLIRDGRMDKFYWNPSREDRIGVCMGIFMDDDVNRGGECSLLACALTRTCLTAQNCTVAHSWLDASQ
jgi:hypothetical protein